MTWAARAIPVRPVGGEGGARGDVPGWADTHRSRDHERPVVTAVENELGVDAIQRMLSRERSRLPLVRDGVLVGVVTRQDLLELMARDVEAP